MKKGGIILVKDQMTRLWIGDEQKAVTLLWMPYQEVIRYKTQETDGYSSVVIGVRNTANSFEEGKEKKFSRVVEYRLDGGATVGDMGSILSPEFLTVGSVVHLSSTSKGKGFQGGMKRHNLRGGPETHGSKFHRAIGSMGNRKPRRVQKGHPHAGHMGDEQVTIKKVGIHDIFTVNGKTYFAVNGSVPGAHNSFVKVFLS